jgi:hypothetical protein
MTIDRPHRRPIRTWIRQGYLDGLEGTAYENAPGNERFPLDTPPGATPERWQMYLAGLFLGMRDRGWITEEAA